MKLRFLLPLLLCASAFGQTWFTVIPAENSASIAMPAGTIFRVGTGTCWSAPVTVTKATTYSPFNFGGVNNFGFADPCPNVVKSLQVEETSAIQQIPWTLNGKVTTVAVPALPVVVVTPPVVTVAKQWQCSFPAGTLTYSLMSDGTFQLANPLPLQITGCTETK